MPPFCRSRCVHPLTSLVDRCPSCASSTWSLPSKVLARCAKMSSISARRSRTLHWTWRSRLRSCAGLSGRSRRTTSAPCDSTASRISSALPTPTKNFGSGVRSGYRTVPAVLAPADAASSRNSSRTLSEAGSSACTRSARSPVAGLSNIEQRPEGRSHRGRDDHARRRRHPVPGAPIARRVVGGQGLAASLSGASGRGSLMFRDGTTVEIACL